MRLFRRAGGGCRRAGGSGFLAGVGHASVALFSDGCGEVRIADIWGLVRMLVFLSFLGARRVMSCFYLHLHIIKGFCLWGIFLFV